MAITGLKNSFVAKYAPNSGNTGYEYTNGAAFARMIDINVAVESNDAELYSDDGLEDSDTSFTKGTLKVTASDLPVSNYALIMGITAGEDGELIFGDNDQPDCGFGFIIVKTKSGVKSYRAIVLPRVKFKIPEDKATTQGEKLTFQSVSVEAKIARDFSSSKAWKKENTFTTEAEAITYIKTALDIT